jgi:DNA polymerase III delta subunit
MLYALIGPDQFAKQQRTAELIAKQPIIRLDPVESLDTAIEAIGQSDLFGQSPTVILDNTSKLIAADGRRLANHLSGNLHTDQIIILNIDDKLPSKSQLTDVLGQAQLEQFPAPTAAQIVNWVQQQALAIGVKIDRSIVPQFALRFGNNKYALYTELQKIAWQDSPIINAQQLSQLVPVGAEGDIFTLTDAWAAKQTSATL